MPPPLDRALLKQFRLALGMRPSRIPRALASCWSAWAEQRSHRLEPARWTPATDGEFLGWRNPPAPHVSVVVPVFNQIDATLECLRSVVGAAGDPGALELIIVDDASTDPGVGRLRTHPGITYHRNDSNVGFVGSSNAGARLARGRYLVFLNSDTLVTLGWLDPLVARLQEPGVGLVGACLQYPDGRLQEAGGLVFADASGWNYGRDGHPDDPRYQTPRDTHYCSGAVLALARERFEGLGGFDPLFAPGYYEDTDLAMRVRASGARVMYEPQSVVVHLEGMSAGTDGLGGMKAAQMVNRHRLLERWADTLHKLHPTAGADADLAIRKDRAAWIVACVASGQGVEFLRAMELLTDKGCVVDLFVLAELPEEEVHRLRSRGVYVWTQAWHATGRWLLLRYASAVDAVLADGSEASGQWLRRVGADLPDAMTEAGEVLARLGR